MIMAGLLTYSFFECLPIHYVENSGPGYSKSFWRSQQRVLFRISCAPAFALTYASAYDESPADKPAYAEAAAGK
jgi:hypothetical protein